MSPQGQDSEFYVGYLPKAPERLGRRLRKTIVALNLVAVAVVLTLILAQAPFAAAHFEFLKYRDYEGIFTKDPYPSLLVSGVRYLLVAPGKHGFDAGADLQARNVRLTGSLIYRDDKKMIEVVPDSVKTGNRAAAPAPEWTSLGNTVAYGEIVDTKCYFGVMNPGKGKVHRDCAVRCISGGIPPGLLVRDTDGTATVILLAGADGRPLNREVLDFVAEPVRIEGQLTRLGDTLSLRTEPKTFYRISEPRP